MRLLRRMAVMLRADAHGVLESLEDRDLLLKQYLREGEMELDRNRAQAEALRDEVAALGAEARRQEESIAALDADVSLAMASGRDDLARFSIRRLLTLRAGAAAIAARIEQRTAQLVGLDERVAEQERKYAELESRVRAELGRQRPSRCSEWEETSVVRDEEVEIELMRRRGGEVAP